ncbi:AraC family transcriptional regulator [Paenibacillus sp. V4I5]|uniref:AraC family transcriptional regulator n=1 Tax=Paenibacillus sp. V4I5 TaxID=3042306 RepID=UPI00278E5DB6|nr:AraC family transcriptional regulator [Paenibacillus sp. V4I5]MDQ0916453.1 two-component system response regulator YesN [Paenibacillus sp. V4I5]
MKWKQWFVYSAYRKMWIYFVLLVALTVMTVSSTLYLFYANQTEKTIGKNLISMLQQTSYTSNIVHQQIITVGTQLQNNNRIITVLMNRTSDKLQDREAMDILTEVQSTYPFIKDIGIYNDYTKRFLTTRGTPYELNDVEKNKILATPHSQYIDLFAQKLEPLFPSSSLTPINVLTFILRPNYALSSMNRGAILINIDEQYIMQTMQSISSASEDSFVIDASGLVLSHTDPSQFMKNFNEISYIHEILESSSKSHYFKVMLNGQQQLVTYVKSDQLGWFFISIKPFAMLISDISVLRSFTWIIVLAIILLGVVTAYFATNKLYYPLGNLIHKVQGMTGDQGSGAKKSQNEFALLSEAFSNVINQAQTGVIEKQWSLPVLKKTYLQHLLRGTQHDLSAAHIMQSDMSEHFANSYYTVILAQIDHYAEFEQVHNQMMQGLLRFSVSNISNELLDKHVRNEHIVVDEQTVAILLFLKSPSISSHILLTLADIQESIHKLFHFTVTFSIGHVVTEQNEIQHSFKIAQDYAKYRFFYGHRSIIHADMVKDLSPKANSYPIEAEKKLCEALRLNHGGKVDQSLALFIKELYGLSYYQAISCANQLLSTLLRDFGSNLPIMHDYSKEYFEVVNKLQIQETLREVHELLQEFCQLIRQLMENKQATKTDTLLAYVCGYLQEHYHEFDLGIEAIADSVQLSPGYLGKLFRNHTQLSFNDYLKNIRLEEAKKLLISTDDGISSISEKVGIINTTYFFTLFKKAYGISPAQYRDQHAKKD